MKFVNYRLRLVGYTVSERGGVVSKAQKRRKKKKKKKNNFSEVSRKFLRQFPGQQQQNKVKKHNFVTLFEHFEYFPFFCELLLLLPTPIIL